MYSGTFRNKRREGTHPSAQYLCPSVVWIKRGILRLFEAHQKK